MTTTNTTNTTEIAAAIDGDRIVFDGPTGRHSLALNCSTVERVSAHAAGYAEANGAADVDGFADRAAKLAADWHRERGAKSMRPIGSRSALIVRDGVIEHDPIDLVAIGARIRELLRRGRGSRAGSGAREWLVEAHALAATVSPETIGQVRSGTWVPNGDGTVTEIVRIGKRGAIYVRDHYKTRGAGAVHSCGTQWQKWQRGIDQARSEALAAERQTARGVTAPELPFEVTEWGSDPDAGNDDCWTGRDFATLAEAEAAFDEPITDTSTEWVQLVGPGVERRRRNPGFRPEADDRSDWIQEQAHQAGMGLGIDAYNDTIAAARESQNATRAKRTHCPECGNELGRDGFCDPCSQAAAWFEDAAYGRD